MEFKLNKIDTDIRKKMQEEIKEDKVHSGKGINVTKNLKDKKNQYIKLDEKENEKRYFTIDSTSCGIPFHNSLWLLVQ